MKRLTVTAALPAILCGLLLSTTCQAQKANQVLALSKAQWHEDLQYFARELPKRHKNLFHTVSREQFERAVADLDAAIPSLQGDQIVVRMLHLTAMIGDGHTYV